MKLRQILNLSRDLASDAKDRELVDEIDKKIVELAEEPPKQKPAHNMTLDLIKSELSRLLLQEGANYNYDTHKYTPEYAHLMTACEAFDEYLKLKREAKQEITKSCELHNELVKLAIRVATVPDYEIGDKKSLSRDILNDLKAVARNILSKVEVKND